MKILAISDIHGDKGLAKKVSEIAKKENVDAILIAGDTTWFNEKATNIIKPLSDQNKEILIIPGNHDEIETIQNFEKTYKGVKNLHKNFHIKNEIGFFGSGTTDWGFKEDEKTIFNELKNAHEKIKNLDKKIMLTHSPPEGSQIELLGFPGSKGITKAIKKFKPDVVICGHIHEGGGLIEEIYGAKVINVSRTPTIFEI